MNMQANNKKPLLIAFWGNLLVMVLKFSAFLLFPLFLIFTDIFFSLLVITSQGLFIIGIGKGRIPTSKQNPFGFSGRTYFIGFILTLMMFSGGAFFSIFSVVGTFETFSHLHFHLPAFLLYALALIATLVLNFTYFRYITRSRGAVPLIPFIKKTKKVDFISAFFEQAALLLTSATVVVALLMKYGLNWIYADKAAGIIIGLIMFSVCLAIGIKLQDLLIGESADMNLTHRIYTLLQKEEGIDEVIALQTLLLSNGSILLSIEAKFKEHLKISEIKNITAGIEQDIRQENHSIKQVYIEAMYLNKGL